jgi:hypothetical protein
MRFISWSCLSLVGSATACGSTPSPAVPDGTCVIGEPVAFSDLEHIAPADRVPADAEVAALAAGIAEARGVRESPDDLDDDLPVPFATGPTVSLVGALWMPWIHCTFNEVPERDDDDLTTGGGAMSCDLGVGRLDQGAVTTLVLAQGLELGLQTMPESVLEDGFGLDAVDVDGDGIQELVVAMETEGESMRAIGAMMSAHVVIVQPSGRHGPAVLIGTRGAASHDTCLSDLFVVDTDCDGRRELHITLTCQPGFCVETPEDPECAASPPRKTRTVLRRASPDAPFEVVQTP